jgi:hypothetical protein
LIVIELLQAENRMLKARYVASAPDLPTRSVRAMHVRTASVERTVRVGAPAGSGR